MSKSKNKKVKSGSERFYDDTNKPSYKDTYYNLVTRENLEGVKKIIKNQGYYDSTTINKIQYRELNSLSHFF